LLIVLVLFYILFVDKEYKTRASKTLNIFSSIGYALPGAVLALSLIIMSSQIKNNVISISLTGTYFLLIHAYFIRFMAVGKSPIKSSIDKMPDNLSESAKNLGLGYFGLAKKLYLPLNKFALLTAFLLCFVDLMKELPMTLILRPFNFDTLATKTYEFAVEEMVDLSSIYSLIIIFVCSVSLFIVKKINHN
jgi:iron(III) transport system permease protein